MFFFKRNISACTDGELLELYNSTLKSEYFGELYNRYIPLLYGLCLKYLQDGDKAQDAVMQLFEDLLPKVARYEIKEFKTWVYSVAKNYCLQLLRKNNPEVLTDFDHTFVESFDILHLLIEDNDDLTIEALNRCIGKLPEPQRISIVAFFMDEMSYADIVEKTGYQLKSVKSYIQNGKRNLKMCIEKNITG